MIPDKEMTEYRKLCVVLASLHEKFLTKRQELKSLLEGLAHLRQEAYMVLANANRITRHLTGQQRFIIGLSYHLGELTLRTKRRNPAFSPGGLDENDTFPETRYSFQENFKSGQELKQNGLMVIGMIDELKKKLLQLEILEMRCRELISSMKKSLEAFRHEFKNIRRRIYPYGIFSQSWRSLRGFFGKSYFRVEDMKELSSLGNITVLVLKIADSPLV